MPQSLEQLQGESSQAARDVAAVQQELQAERVAANELRHIVEALKQQVQDWRWHVDLAGHGFLYDLCCGGASSLCEKPSQQPRASTHCLRVCPLQVAGLREERYELRHHLELERTAAAAAEDKVRASTAQAGRLWWG